MQWGEDACWFSLKCDQKIALSLPYWGRGFAGTPRFRPAAYMPQLRVHGRVEVAADEER